jgi:hypothetical protein
VFTVTTPVAASTPVARAAIRLPRQQKWRR